MTEKMLESAQKHYQTKHTFTLALIVSVNYALSAAAATAVCKVGNADERHHTAHNGQYWYCSGLAIDTRATQQTNLLPN